MSAIGVAGLVVGGIALIVAVIVLIIILARGGVINDAVVGTSTTWSSSQIARLNTSQDDRISTLESQVGTLQTRVSSLETRVTALENSIATLADEIWAKYGDRLVSQLAALPSFQQAVAAALNNQQFATLVASSQVDGTPFNVLVANNPTLQSSVAGNQQLRTYVVTTLSGNQVFVTAVAADPTLIDQVSNSPALANSVAASDVLRDRLIADDVFIGRVSDSQVLASRLGESDTLAAAVAGQQSLQEAITPTIVLALSTDQEFKNEVANIVLVDNAIIDSEIARFLSQDGVSVIRGADGTLTIDGNLTANNATIENLTVNNLIPSNEESQITATRLAPIADDVFEPGNYVYATPPISCPTGIGLGTGLAFTTFADDNNYSVTRMVVNAAPSNTIPPVSVNTAKYHIYTRVDAQYGIRTITTGLATDTRIYQLWLATIRQWS